MTLMSSSKCKDCDQDNPRADMGLDTCGHCEPAVSSVRRVVDESPKKQKYKPAPKPSGGTVASGTISAGKIAVPVKMRYPKGVCQKCGDVLARGSNSYCRLHERERLRAWRKKNAK